MIHFYYVLGVFNTRHKALSIEDVCTIFIADELLGAGIQKINFGIVKKDFVGMESSMFRADFLG